MIIIERFDLKHVYEFSKFNCSNDKMLFLMDILNRILRWVRDEQSLQNSKRNEIEYLILDFGGMLKIHK